MEAVVPQAVSLNRQVPNTTQPVARLVAVRHQTEKQLKQRWKQIWYNITFWGIWAIH